MYSVLVVTALRVVFLSFVVCYCTCDDPLIVTPFLNSTQHVEAQRLSMVQPSIGKFVSYAGFFQIKDQCESNLFFWYLPAQKRNSTEAPTILWQQGGPGTSSLFGLMKEIGSLRYRNSSGLTKVESHWNNENNLLIIEGAGTGYSHGKENCYPQDEKEMGEDLYQGLIQFYTMFPELKNSSLIAAGQSYGPRITAALARIILERNPTAEIKMNLTALIMISAFIDPPNQQSYGPYLESIGLIDWHQRALYEAQEQKCLKATQDQRWSNATVECNVLITDLFSNTVGDGVDNEDFSPVEDENDDWIIFLKLSETRKALHVGNLDYLDFNNDLYNALNATIYQSVRTWIEYLLNRKIPIVFINGQRDIVCAYSLLTNALRQFNWKGKQQYLKAKRYQWCVNDTQAGYVKSASQLHEVLVLKAGHAVPQNQPAFGEEMVNSITVGSPKNPFQNIFTCEN